MEQCWKELMLKNLQCDICSKQVQSKFLLYNLREIYQTEDIVRVCEECNYVIDKQLQKLQDKCWSGKIDVGDISKDLKEHIIKLKCLSRFKARDLYKKNFFDAIKDLIK